MKELSVVVSGTAASGKTTIARIIRRALSLHGLKHEVVDDEHPTEAEVDDRVQALAMQGLRVRVTVLSETRIDVDEGMLQ